MNARRKDFISFVVVMIMVFFATSVYGQHEWVKDEAADVDASALAYNSDDELTGAFPAFGVWHYAGSWSQMVGNDAVALAYDSDDNLAGAFPGWGIYVYDGDLWEPLVANDATALAYSADGGLTANFPGWGVWHFDGTDWALITGTEADALAYNAAGNLVGGFPGVGVYELVEDEWAQLSDVVSSALTAGTKLAGSFPGYGVWAHNGTWAQLVSADATSLAYNFNGDLAGAFGLFGVWYYLEAQEFTLNLLSDPEEYGEVEGGGIYFSGAEVEVVASAFDGYKFVHWKDGKGNIVSATNPYTFNMPFGDETLIAVFGVEPVLEIVAEDLGQIWAIEFLPGTSYLLANENSGSIFLIDTETLEIKEITGAPDVASGGQGGLLDMAVSPEFEADNLIYLTYSAANQAGETTTHLARATLSLGELSLSDLEVLYFAKPFLNSTAHYGSRVVIQGDYLYMTIGDRGDKNFENHVSQDTTNVLGTTLRLLRDGTIPEANPFVGDPGVLDEIYTYGHRNSQGMTIHPDTGEIWQSEHGERDGDEINIIRGGNNYGWPIATYSCTYATGQQIGVLPEERDDTVNPVHYWECGSGGFPPAGMTFYNADGFINWQGDLFVGGLASQYLAHFRVTANGLEELEPMLAEEGWRFRDVTVGQHDGAIYAAVEGHSVSIIRIVPKLVE